MRARLGEERNEKYGSISSAKQADARHEEVDEICGRGEGSDVCGVVPERGVVGAEEDDAAGAADVDYVFLSSCKARCFLPSSIASSRATCDLEFQRLEGTYKL